MKGIFAILIVVAIAAAWYYVPTPHHRANTGTYFVRDYISFTTPNGVIGWGPGQEIREDLKAPFIEGSKTVTDGRFTAIMPEAILTQDIEDAEALRAADSAGQSQAKSELAALKTRIAKQAFTAQLASAQDMVLANAQQVAASTIGLYNTALNEPARAVGYYYWHDSEYYNNRAIYIVRMKRLLANPAPTPLPGLIQRSATPAPQATPAVGVRTLTGY